MVNQFTVEYTDNGQKETRRPDILLFVNGMPVCIIELKNPADANATIYDAWEQINIRYWRDIPHLTTLLPVGVHFGWGQNKTWEPLRTPYEHFYAWRRVHDGDAVSTLPFAETADHDSRSVCVRNDFWRYSETIFIFRTVIYDSEETRNRMPLSSVFCYKTY